MWRKTSGSEPTFGVKAGDERQDSQILGYPKALNQHVCSYDDEERLPETKNGSKQTQHLDCALPCLAQLGDQVSRWDLNCLSGPSWTEAISRRASVGVARLKGRRALPAQTVPSWVSWTEVSLTSSCLAGWVPMNPAISMHLLEIDNKQSLNSMKMCA